MNSKAKLESGFTLVELIVSMAIIAIIFGSIMQVVSPTSRFFDKTSDFKNQVDIAETFTSEIEAKIRYSPNVLVLENYVGVPVVDNKNQLVDIADVEFNSVLIIDNNNPRGSAFTNFNADSSPSRRKGATGQVIKVPLYKKGIDLKLSSLILSEEFFSDYSYIMNATGNLDNNGLGYIGFNTEIYNYTHNESGYLYNLLEYEASTSMYLTNINLLDDDGRQIYIKNFNNSIDDADYTGYSRATTPASLKVGQKAFYTKDDADNSYTYIFYYEDRSNNKKVNVIFDPGEGAPSGATNSIEVKMGENTKLTEAEIPAYPKTGYDTYTDVVNGETYNRKFVGWCSTIHGDTGEPSTWLQPIEFADYVLIEDETFVAMYELVSNKIELNFYDSFGILLPGYKTSGLDGTPFSGSIPPMTIPAGKSGAWIVKDSSPPIVVDMTNFNYSFTITAVQMYFYDNHKVTFYDSDGGNLVEEITVISGGNIAFDHIPAVPVLAGHEGRWVMNVGGVETTTIDYNDITSDMTIYAKYTPVAHSLVTQQLQNNGGSVGFHIANNDESTAVAKLKLTLTFSAAVNPSNSGINSGGANFTEVVVGNTVTIYITNAYIKDYNTLYFQYRVNGWDNSVVCTDIKISDVS